MTKDEGCRHEYVIKGKWIDVFEVQDRGEGKLKMKQEVDLENLDWQIRNLKEEGRNRFLLNCWYVAHALCTLVYNHLNNPIR